MSLTLRKPRSWRLLAAVGLAFMLALLTGVPTSGLIRHSITIDGNVGDWGDVLTDPENVVADSGSFSDPPDPDAPGTADRDLRGVAFTWDNTNLYIFFRRTLSGNSSFDFLAYIDLGHDKKLTSSDRILRLSYSGAAYQSGALNAYVPVNVAGDDITGDGVDEPGQLGAPTGGVPVGANSPDGIEFEASISWAALGVPAGSCLWIHPSIARGTNLPSQVEDNTNPLDTQDVAVRLEQDRAGSAASPGFEDHAHRACNDGNCADTIDLGVRSNSGWRVEIYSDPNGDGDPSDGVLRGVDGNGDGDYSDDRDGDSIASGADTNGNGVVDTGSLAAGACYTFVARIVVPAGVSTGTVDLERVRARSGTRAQDLRQNNDTTTVGPVTIFEDEQRTGFAGDDVWTAHRTCNNQGVADTLNLTSSSALGWATEVWSDPNGDGDPSDGAVITNTGSLAPGACFNVILRATVPGGATAGTVDSVTVTTTSQANTSVTDAAVDTITVRAARFALTPNHVRDAGPFNTLFLPHVVTNNQSLDDNFALTVTGVPAGWTATLLTDPNGNGEPDDSTTIANGGVIGPAQNNGGDVRFILRVDIPQGAAIGTVATITVTATSQLDTSRTSVATDTITIRRILTYSDPLFARPSATFFVSCAQVYVQAHGLQSNRDYRFKWYDPTNTLQRTSPTYQADARGRSDDSFSLPCGIVPGQWKIDLEIRSGSTWSIVSSTNFTTFDPAVTSGDITRLETDQGVYNVDGDTFIVESELTNDTSADYVGTRADYVVFRDVNGDGVPTTGEDYIQADGTRSTWDPGEFTHRTSNITIYAGASFQDFWSIANADFDIQGTWCVHERWYQICTSGSCSDVTIDTALTCFLVSCLPAPVVDAGANKQACQGDVVALSDATSNADTFSWSDGGAGGSFSPSSTVLNPSYSPPGLGTFTLTLVGTFTATGCTAQDTVNVTVHANPVVTAGADKASCAGESVALSDADGGAADTFSWSDGGAGGVFTPNDAVENPSYSNATPGAYTLTFMASVAATGCDSNDTVSVTVNANPVVTAGSDKTTCSDVAVALSDADGGAADTFSWSDGGAGGTFSPSAAVENPSYSNLTAGTYTLTLTATVAATGCDASDALTMTVNAAPVATAGADKATCAGEEIALLDADGGAADAFSWSDGGAGGTFTPSASVENPSYSNAAPGTYTLTFTATVTATGCDTADTLSVTVNANPVVTAGADKTICADESAPLGDADGGAADTFAWSDGGAGGSFAPSASVENPTYSNPTAGTHVLTFTATVSATGCDSSDTLSVTVNPNPVVNAGADKEICADESVSLADADGGAADTYSWTDGGAGGTFTPNAAVENPTYSNPTAGVHTLTFTATIAATGCDAVDTVKITVNANPVVTAGADKAVCAGELVALSDADGGAADTFSWSDGGAGGTFDPSASVENPSYSNATPGTYTLTLTATIAATGCDNVDTLSVTVNANPVVTAGADKAVCAGELVALSDADGGAADTYSWSDGGAGGTFTPSASVENPSYSNASPGTYTLTFTATVAATGCDNADTLSVTVNANPIVTAGADKAVCAGELVALSDADGGTADTFSWSDGGAGGTFTPSASVENPSYSNPTAGTYTLTLTASIGSSGCDGSDTLSVTVNPNPVVTAGADKSGCPGLAVALSDADGGAADTFSWSDGGAGGTFAPNASVENPTYSNAIAGTYTLTFTASIGATGCDSSDTLVVTINPRPSVDAGAPKDGCVGAPIALSDATSDGSTFSWSDGGAGGSFSPSATVLNPSYTRGTAGAVTLTLTATSGAGCSASDTVSVTVRALPVAAFTTPAPPLCEDTPVCFTNQSTDATSYLWEFGDADGNTSTEAAPCFAYSDAGTYTVRLTATNNCGSNSVTHSVTINPKPTADFSFSTQGNRFCKNKNVNFTDLSTQSPTSWQWDFDDGATSTLQNPSHAYLTDGIFIVSLVACNACGCSPPTYQAVEIAASCNTNCEANSNQIECSGPPTSITGDTCTDHDNFNTTSYACAPDYIYSGENKSYDLNFLAGSNFVIRLVETVAEPNGYELDIMISDRCNPPNCVAWGDSEVGYDDRTAAMDDFYLIVDGRDGSCGPFRLEIDCIDPTESAACTPPVFDGIVDAQDLDPCSISGILVTWDAAASWGTGTDGAPCPGGTYEIWRAPASDPSNERRVGSAPSGSSSFTDENAVPGLEYIYRVNAINSCCAEAVITTATAQATDDYNDSAVTANAGPDRMLTCTVLSVTLLGSASGGSGSGFDYSWSPTAGLSDPLIPNPTATIAGTYTLTVTDRDSGCVDTDIAIVVGNNVPPTVSAGADKDVTCSTPVVTLDGSATGGDSSSGRTYSWSPSGPLSDPASPTPQTSTPGTYTLTVTDNATGCLASDSVVVVDDDAPPTAGAGLDKVIDCDTPSVVLDGSASGGDGRSGYSFSWSPAAGLSDPSAQAPTATAAGTWTLTVTDIYTGCTDTDSVSVSEDIAAPTAGAGPDQEITCTITSVTLDGSASGGNGSAGYSYSWSPADQLDDPDAEDPTTSIAGTYTLTVTDLANGCTGTDIVVVTLSPDVPRANAGPDKEITCTQTSVLLEGSASGGDGSLGYSYHWEPAADVSDPDIAQPTTTTPGVYTLTVTSLADGCANDDSVVVADNDAPPIASAGADAVIDCGTPSVVLQGSASGGDGSDGYSFSWSPPTGLSDPNVAQPTATQGGTYTLTVTDVHTGCVDTDDVVVGEDFAAPTASAGPDKTLDCATASVVLEGSAAGGNGSAGYSYSWSPTTGLSDPAIAQPTASAPGTYTLTVTDLFNDCSDTDTVTIAQDVAAPTASAGLDKALDCDTPSVTLDGSASGGNGSAGYSYSWSPAAGLSDPSIAQPTATAPGTYTLTVTDLANSCIDTDSVVVTQDLAAPTANAGSDKTIDCDTPSVVLQGSASGGDGSAGYSYSWTPTAGLSDPAVAQPTATIPGAYTLTVTAIASGCQDTDVVFVNDDRIAPIASAGPDKAIDCDTASVVLQGSASGGNGSAGYSYSWAPAAGLSNPAIAQPTCNAPGTYTLTVTDLANACTSTDTVTVVEDRRAPSASAGADKVLDCDTNTVTLDGSASGGNGTAGYSYFWSPPFRVSNPTIANPTTTRSGTYTLTVTDLANGCTGTDTVIVTVDRVDPLANAGPDKTIDCDTPSVVLDGSASGGNGSAGYSFSWTPTAGLSDPLVAQPTATAAGTYTLTVTDLANGCSDTNTVVVSADQRAPVAAAGADKVLDCDTTSVTLDGSASGGNGSAGYSYSWTPTAGLSDPLVAQPSATVAGTYTLTVTALANGCTATDTVTVTSDLRAPTASAGPDVVLDCALPSVTLNGSGSGGNGSAGYSYHWEPAGTVSDPNIAVTQAFASGTYTLTVTDLANGCVDTDDVVVTSSAPPPVANAGQDGRISCASATAPLSGTASGGNGSLGYTTRWSPTTGVADPNALVTTTTEPGTYTLLVIDNATGCRSADTVVIADDRVPPTVSAGPDGQVDCDTPSVVLQGSASGGNGSSGYAYSWAPAAGLSNASIAQPTTSQAGTWTLTVTDIASGCQATDSVTVIVDTRAPLVSAGLDKILGCGAAGVTLDGSAAGGSGAGFTYRWTPAAGLSDPRVAQPVATQARTYTLTVTDQSNGCTGSDSVTVVIDQAVPVANAGADSALTCTQPLAALAGSASGGNGSLGYSYSWTPAAGVVDPNAAVTQAFVAGTYTLTVTDLANGCTDTDTVDVAAAVGAPLADAGPDQQQSCTNPSVTLTGAASGGDGSLGYTFRWEPAANVANPNAAATTTSLPGIYTLTITDVATGCQAADATIVAASSGPIASAGNDADINCLAPLATLEGSATGGDGSLGFEYRWEPAADVADPNAASTTTTIAGTYTLTVTDVATGCVSVDTVTVSSVSVPVFPEPSALDVTPSATPLRVTWVDPQGRTTLDITWEDVGAFEYRVYMGSLLNLRPPRGAASYDHAALACGLTAARATPAIMPGAVYFIAVSANCDGVESSYGRDSLGIARPDALTASGSPCP